MPKNNNSDSNNILDSLSEFQDLCIKISGQSDASKAFSVSVRSAIESLSYSSNLKTFEASIYPAFKALSASANSASNIVYQKELLKAASLAGQIQASNLVSSVRSIDLSSSATTVIKDFLDSISKVLSQAEEIGFNLQESIKIIQYASHDFLKTQNQFDITSEERENIEHNETSHEQYVELPEDTFENISDILITIPPDVYFLTGQKQILVKKSFYDFYCQCLIPTLSVLVAIIALIVNSPSPGSINNYSNATIEQNATIINNYFNIDDIDFENRATDSDHQNKILTPDSDPEDFDSIPEPESESVDNNP